MNLKPLPCGFCLCSSDFQDTVGQLPRGLTPLLLGEGSLAPPSLLGKGAGGLGFPNSPTTSFQSPGCSISSCFFREKHNLTPIGALQVICTQYLFAGTIGD